ncbi:recombinase family protein [Granulicella aggregans]|uniref:recombinase family protein n=1 Tax=Granulicella aggregans TaxID=474949 RepID=UPI0021DFDE4C|nr:recombinase family protein [Granulicella aggregans]
MHTQELPQHCTTYPTAGLIRCAVYARYSSNKQDKSSIEDQIRNVRRLAQQKGWVILEQHVYIDKEKSGTTTVNRPGFQAMMAEAKSAAKPFDYIIVDDVSRFARKKADCFLYVDILTHRNIFIYFVEEGLDSSERSFEEGFHNKAQQAQQYSKSLSFKVKRGREGRFLAGYNPGGGCYGYDNVPEEDLTRKGDYGRPYVVGVRQVINPETADIVRWIFTLYAAGVSLRDVVAALNDRGIHPPQNPRKCGGHSWSKTGIREMLRNERYRGTTIWGRSEQKRDPETGKMTTFKVPESQWLRQDHPELRIVSDELWNQVQEQFARATTGLGVQRKGGMTRTENARRYLFSGLLKCGVCEGRMNITSNKPARYGCVAHRDRLTCSNKTTIRVDLLESAFLSALTVQLTSTSLRDEMVRELLEQVNSTKMRRSLEQATVEKERLGLVEARRVLLGEQANLLAAIRANGHSRSLLADLDSTEVRIDRINERLDGMIETTLPDFSEEEIRSFLDKNAQSFLDLLSGEPEFVRNELQKRMSPITLTPDTEEGRFVYRATGGVSLFSSPVGVLQGNPVHPIALQYTTPISFAINRKERSSVIRDASPSRMQVAA